MTNTVVYFVVVMLKWVVVERVGLCCYYWWNEWLMLLCLVRCYACWEKWFMSKFYICYDCWQGLVHVVDLDICCGCWEEYVMLAWWYSCWAIHLTDYNNRTWQWETVKQNDHLYFPIIYFQFICNNIPVACFVFILLYVPGYLNTIEQQTDSTL